MTVEIALVFAILFISLVLFITEKIRMDLTALLVLGTLAVTGLVTPSQAFEGFSNGAVITVWAMFILSEGLTRTGVAALLGRKVLVAAGGTEIRLIMVVMLVAAVMSAFMNNIGVAALMLPVVLNIARKTGCAPSRLLMPLAYGTLLGGLTTLIGTPPNLLISNALKETGRPGFSLFDFSSVGGIAMIAGILFVALIGRHLLPRKDPARENGVGGDGKGLELEKRYSLSDRMFVMRIPESSHLSGVTLGESRLGAALGLNILAIVRNQNTQLIPNASTVLREGDRLIAQGRLDRLENLRGWQEFGNQVNAHDPRGLTGEGASLAEVRIAPQSSLIGKTLLEANFRFKFKAMVLVIRRAEASVRGELPQTVMATGDTLLVQGTEAAIEALKECKEFDAFEYGNSRDVERMDELKEKLFEVVIPADSVLVGLSLEECRLGDAFGLRVLGIIRAGKRQLLPEPDEKLHANDQLIIHGTRRDLQIVRGLQEIVIESEKAPDLSFLEADDVGMMEVMLSPRSKHAGRNLRDLKFRDRFGLQVIAIWRGGRSYRSGLRDMSLELGDAFLVIGKPNKLALLQKDPDFLALTPVEEEELRTHKAPVAAVIMAAVLLPVLLGWLPISVSSICGVCLMVLTGCLKMDEAYQAIEWKAVFLIAGMLPLGVAMQDTGAASLVAHHVVGLLGDLGPWPVIFGLYLITAVATTIIPTAALVLLMAPITLQTCSDLGVSPYPAMMAVAMAASASFTSPISHPANILVMGPGGYRFVDYVKMGIPLAMVVFVITMVVLPIFWPLHP